MTFEEASNWLTGFQFHGIKPGLERITQLLARLGHPERTFSAVHIAGTNGKGSTAALLEVLLRYHGLKTGLYTSPHLVSVCERFVINGRPISKDRFASLCTQVRRALGELPATYFELTTAMAFLLFAAENVDWAVVECGLGGRLDATNVVSPEVAVITTVGLDHQAYLGHSLEEIAREKAGIIKAQKPVVVGPLAPEALAVVTKKAQELSAPLWCYGRDFRVWEGPEGKIYQGKRLLSALPLSLSGPFQQINLALALKTYEVLESKGLPFQEEKVRQALSQVGWPGRYEKFKAPGLVILDGAHNLDGVKALLEALEKEGLQRYQLLFAASDEGGTKPYLAMLRMLLPKAQRVFICEPPGPRRPVKISQWARELGQGAGFAEKGPANLVLCPSWEEALERALKDTSFPLVVTGSLYLVGRVRERLLSKLKS